MNARTTIDPISLNDVTDLEDHPGIYEGDGDNGREIFFEKEKNRRAVWYLQITDKVVLQRTMLTVML